MFDKNYNITIYSIVAKYFVFALYIKVIGRIICRIFSKKQLIYLLLMQTQLFTTVTSFGWLHVEFLLKVCILTYLNKIIDYNKQLFEWTNKWSPLFVFKNVFRVILGRIMWNTIRHHVMVSSLFDHEKILKNTQQQQICRGQECPLIRCIRHWKENDSSKNLLKVSVSNYDLVLR